MKPSTRAAVGAAVAVARAHGADVRDPLVMHARANVVVHLRPAPLVARVASTTAVMRTDARASLARDVAVARFAASHGAPVVPPATDVEPGPHAHGGRVLTFWPYVEHDRDAHAAPRELGRTLAAVHRSLRDCNEPLPRLGPIAELDQIVDALEALAVIDRAEADRLRDRVLACRAALPPPGAADRPLHGDAHGGNVLVTPDGVRWTDFEDCCRGPIAWDLARLVERAGPDALAGYGAGAPSETAIAVFVEARTVQRDVWVHVAAARDDGRLDPALDRLAS